ncbi:MAG TPA: hypothetical protein EYN67_06640 [Flavobacteriales bacterium]|nr:hypothetical protein [Flavobacteriales bacterium]
MYEVGKIIQSPDRFFVCVRIRNKWGVPYSLRKRIGPLEIKEAHQTLSKSIEKYGCNYEIVIEPATHVDRTADSCHNSIIQNHEVNNDSSP